MDAGLAELAVSGSPFPWLSLIVLLPAAAALVLPPTKVGMIEQSTIRKPVSPRTHKRESTTAISSTPILQVPTG